MLRDLIFAFDDENGVSQDMFTAVYALVVMVMGQKAADAFSSCIDATENRFYFREGTKTECWQKMRVAQAEQVD